jgi:hypothetical protein
VSARRREAGSSPLAFEMSCDWSRIAPGRGAAVVTLSSGTQLAPNANETSSSRCQAIRYG